MRETLRKVSACLLALTMLQSALLHAYWAMGGKWFLSTALNMELKDIPQELLWMIWVFVPGMLLVALLALERTGLIRLGIPGWLTGLGLWTFTLLMLLGAAYNFTLSRIWVRWVFAPIFLVLGMLSFHVALPAQKNM